MAKASVVFFVSVFALISVLFRICLEYLLSFDRALNIHVRNLIFFRQAVRQDGNLAPVKEIKQPILNMALFGAQFINAISQIIGRGSPEFVPRLRQKLDSSAVGSENSVILRRD